MSTISTSYIPDINETFKSGKGICYDFSSLFAAMLRSAGIPAKLVKGYTDNAVGYHAWNEVYDSAAGSWVTIDTTYDSQIKASGAAFTMIKDSGSYSKLYEY
jgi:transglutaminase-like putative cysteine protease